MAAKRKAKKAAPKPTMPIKEQRALHKGGHYAFFTGIFLVVVSAILNYYVNFMTFSTTIIVLGLLGLIVGILNITRKETESFLLASLVIVVAFWLTMPLVTEVHNLLYNIWVNIIVFIAMMAIVVAFKTVYELASDY